MKKTEGMKKEMYHIIYDLERKFVGLEDCWRWLETLVLEPRIPYHRMIGEDRSTPRVCVGETIEDCVTAIGVEGVFKRCFYNEDFYLPPHVEYEAYPIVVVKLSNDLYYRTPTEAEVPDVAITNEKWLLEAAVPVNAEIVWLDISSIEAYYDFDFDSYICSSFRPLRNTVGYSHPWLNREGRPLIGGRWDMLCEKDT